MQLGRGLLTANGPRWARSRRLLTPAFHYDILRPYIKVYADASNELVQLWSDIPEGQSFNASPYISLLTLDIMLRCTCSYKSNCQLTKYGCGLCVLYHMGHLMCYHVCSVLGVIVHTYRLCTN